MIDNIVIKSPRQRRALEALLHNPVSVKDLGPIIGALNPRQTIFELRQQGLRGIILTRPFPATDRDGKVCHPGEYYIPEERKPFVEKILKNQDPLAQSKCSGGFETNDSSDCKGEVE